MAVDLMITSGTWRKIEALPVSVQKNVRSVLKRAEEDIQRLLELHAPPGPTEQEKLLEEYKQLCQRRQAARKNIDKAKEHLRQAHELRERRFNEVREITCELMQFTQDHSDLWGGRAPDISKGHIDPTAAYDDGVAFWTTETPKQAAPGGVDEQITWRPEEGGILR